MNVQKSNWNAASRELPVVWQVRCRSETETACSDVGTFDNKLVFIRKVDDKVVSGERAHEYRVIAHFWALCIGQPTANTCVYECSTNYIYFAPLALRQRVSAACGWRCGCEPAYRTQNNYHHKVLADEKTFLFYDGRQPPKEKNWARYEYRCCCRRRRHRKSARDEYPRGREKRRSEKSRKKWIWMPLQEKSFSAATRATSIVKLCVLPECDTCCVCVRVFTFTDCHFLESVRNVSICTSHTYTHTHSQSTSIHRMLCKRRQLNRSEKTNCDFACSFG